MRTSPTGPTASTRSPSTAASASNTLTGSSRGDAITGAGGDDNFDGGVAIDASIYTNGRFNYFIQTTFTGGQFVTSVSDSTGVNGTDTLRSTETLGFNNGAQAFANFGIQQNRISNYDSNLWDDVAIQNTTTGQTLYINMNGLTGSSGQGVLLGALPAGWKSSGSADFTGDGRAELLVQNTTNGAFYSVNFASGAPVWTTINASINSNFQVVDTGDVLRDGTADVLLKDVSTNIIWLADVDTGGSFGGWTNVGNYGAGWRTVALGDLNRDGGSDVVIQEIATGLTYYRDVNNATFGYVAGGLGTTWILKATGDVNGDGYSDAIYQNTITGDVWYQNMLGGNGLTGPGFGVVGYGLSAYSVAGTADVNNDGYVDVILRDNANGTVIYAAMSNGANAGYYAISGALGTDWVVV